jgi:signal transduction histidine kinase
MALSPAKPPSVQAGWLSKLKSTGIFLPVDYFHRFAYSNCLASCLVLLTLFTFLVYYPFIDVNTFHSFKSSQNNVRPIAEVLGSRSYERWLLVCIFVPLPTFIQIVMEVWTMFGDVDENTFWNWMGSFLLYFFLVIPHVIIYLIVFQADDFDFSSQLVYGHMATMALQTVGISLGLLIQLLGHEDLYAVSNNDSRLLTFTIGKQSVNYMLIMVIGCACFIIGRATLQARCLAVAVVSLGFFWVFLLVGQRLLHLSRQYYHQGFFLTQEHMSDFFYGFSLCCFVATTHVIVLSSELNSFSASLLLNSILYIDIALASATSLIPAKKMKHLAEIKRQKLETRLNLIRYVSHEMRTPLNTATMGLTFLINELKTLKRKMRCVGGGGGGGSSTIGYDSIDSSIDHNERSLHVDVKANNMYNALSLPAINELLEVTTQVNESCGVAVSTLDDLLMFDKLDERKLIIEATEINPWVLLSSTTKPFFINAKNAQVNFHVQKSDSQMSWLNTQVVLGDPFKLSQVIRNVVSNALKFTAPKGTVEVTLSQVEITHKLYARITVKDDGAGISPQNLKKLFGKYVQFKASELQQGKGSGLGLWITKSELKFFLSTMTPLFFLTS